MLFMTSPKIVINIKNQLIIELIATLIIYLNR